MSSFSNNSWDNQNNNNNYLSPIQEKSDDIELVYTTLYLDSEKPRQIPKSQMSSYFSNNNNNNNNGEGPSRINHDDRFNESSPNPNELA